MQRREFVQLASAAATGGLLADAPPSAAAPRLAWQPDGVGSLARLGVLTPAFDPVPESEAQAMAPRGVSIHASRVPWRGGDARSFAEPPQVDPAVELLAALKPQAILYAFTSSSYFLGMEGDEALRLRLEARAAGVPIVLAAVAATEALRALNVRRLMLVHPIRLGSRKRRTTRVGTTSGIKVSKSSLARGSRRCARSKRCRLPSCTAG